MAVPRAVAVLVMLAVVLAGLVAVRVPGSAYDGAEGAGRPKVPGTSRFVVVNHNVERRQSAVQDALTRAAGTRAPLILLQEVCWWQADAIRADHPQWTVGWRADVDTPNCRRRGLAAIGDGGRRESGNVAIWTGGARGHVTAHTFRYQVGRRFRSNVVCVSWLATGVVRRGCSTHLINASGSPERRGTQFRQARAVNRLTRPWIRRDNLVVVGGDFNASPSSRPLDEMYAVDGGGRFQEATGCQRALDFCRRSLGTTFDGGRIKIDYIFYSANRVPAGAARSLRVVPTRSDHHLLTGWAYLDLAD